MSFFDALLRYPLFALLGRKGLGLWLSQGQTETVPTGRVLLEAGTPGKYVWLVLEGGVRVLSHGKDDRDVPLGVFGPGETFGEYALLAPHRNTATCRAREPSRLLRLPLEPLRTTLASLPSVEDHLKNWLRLHALLSHLRGQTFLGFLSVPSVLPILDRCREETVPAGHTIQAEGLGDDAWLYLRTGRVAIRTGRNGCEALRLLGPGDSFGEQALLSSGKVPRAEAEVDSSLLRLSREEFVRPLTGSAPSLLQTINPARGIARQLRQWVPQLGTVDCGVASLAMAAWQLGIDVSVERVAAAVPLEERGASLRTLIEAAARLGLRANAVRVAPTLLDQLHGVAVAHLVERHYVTLFEVRRDTVCLGDPAVGVVEWPLERFLRSWSGVLLLLTPPGQSD